MGKAKGLELIKKFEPSLTTINEILVVYPEFKPGIIENARLLFLDNKWDFS